VFRSSPVILQLPHALWVLPRAHWPVIVVLPWSFSVLMSLLLEVEVSFPIAKPQFSKIILLCFSSRLWPEDSRCDGWNLHSLIWGWGISGEGAVIARYEVGMPRCRVQSKTVLCLELIWFLKLKKELVPMPIEKPLFRHGPSHPKQPRPNPLLQSPLLVIHSCARS